MSYQTLDDLADGQRVVVRVDLNSPVSEGRIRDNRRFVRHADTIRELVEADHRVAVLAHQGRPGRESFTSLEQHADTLAEHLGTPVEFVPDTYGPTALEAVRNLESGDVVLLENVRMVMDELPEREPEEHAGSTLVRTLTPEFDAYVNDAYSAAHRSHASLVGFPLAMDAYAGRVMVAEHEANSAIATREFDGDVTMVAGGKKATDVIEVMTALEGRVDNFLLGGIAGELFLRALGYEVGRDVGDTDVYDEQYARNREKIQHLIEAHPSDLVFPTDLAYEDDGERAEETVADVRDKDHDYLDVGTDTTSRYADIAASSTAVFVKGALGVFEDERFSYGTVNVLEAIGASGCFSVVGGGDTSRAIEMYGLRETDFSHVSIAGGAYIRALTGTSLPAVEVLKRSSEAELGE